jgi:hypothetical protein
VGEYVTYLLISLGVFNTDEYKPYIDTLLTWQERKDKYDTCYRKYLNRTKRSESQYSGRLIDRGVKKANKIIKKLQKSTGALAVLSEQLTEENISLAKIRLIDFKANFAKRASKRMTKKYRQFAKVDVEEMRMANYQVIANKDELYTQFEMVKALKRCTLRLAGYIHSSYEDKVDFLLRFKDNLEIYQELATLHLNNLIAHAEEDIVI